MDVMTNVQKAILQAVPQIPDGAQFYLTGGTALAHFYLRHRQSKDLDFFTTVEELILPFGNHLETILKRGGMTVTRQRGFKSFIELVVTRSAESTLIHIALDAPFRFEPVQEFPDYPGVKIDSLIDMATNKLLALFGRATLRDFIDVYYLLSEGKFSRDELIAKAKQKDPGFDTYWLGVAMERIKAYPPNSADMLLMLKQLDFNQLALFFEEWRTQISKGLVSK